MKIDIITIPNFISISRVLATFLAISLYLTDASFSLICILLGMYSMLSDFLDGFVARRFKQQSMFGEMLDQVADSVALSALLLLGVYLHKMQFLACLLFLLREFWVSAMRRHAAIYQIRIPSSSIGRHATNLIGFGVLFSYLSILNLVAENYSSFFLKLGTFVLDFGLALSFLSAILYTRFFIKEIRLNAEPSKIGQ